MEIFTYILLFSVIVLLFALWRRNRRGNDWPPGPPTLPLLGNINVNFEDLPAEFRKFRQQYGDVFSLIIGTKTVIVINGLHTLKEFFVTNGDKTNDRPDTMFTRDMAKFGGIAGSSGKFWKDHRTFAITTLRELGFGKRSMEERILEEVDVFLDVMKRRNGEEFDVSELLSISVSNVICSVTFGTRYSHDDGRFKFILNLISESLADSRVGGILTFFPFLKYIPGDLFHYKKIMSNIEKMYDHIRLIIDEHKESPHVTTETPNNYLDAFLKQQRERHDRKLLFEDFQLLRHLTDLFLAGTETTATALRWFILALLHQPDIQRRMRREIENAVGARIPSLSDRKKLPFCDAVLHETLRFGNIGPLSLPHGLAEDISFMGYKIPKDAIVIQCLDSIMMDSSLFKNPSQFNPMRFLTKDGELAGTENVYPFGIGRRICPGENLARMELFLFAIGMIQRFELLPPGDEDIPSLLLCRQGTTRSPLPFKVRAVERT
ncbi:hypothetical protein FSP39_021877 [Pinctada imbricata]|uniref:Uncharacterized protein n=1 Tax=Pinctada imbricata TaxID=66713 RepID=A0AA88XGZ4_PINIB|nr:hypothetical protein FSP39_021877 [Pinctada imbricata]